jgi:sodium transport system ATP-binding protein
MMGISVAHLKKQFHDPSRGPFFAVNDVSFECVPGEIFGLLGPNGAGKTTIMRTIATIMKPTTGVVTVNGHDALADSENVRKSIGFLSSDTGLYERLTPREILTYFCKLYRMETAAIARRVDVVMARLGITAYADALCGSLSTGMKQRVSIARAVVHDPPVLILDEPTSGLDIIGIRAIHEFVMSAKAENKCILFSTHIMAEAEKLCDRIGLLERGQILACGTLQELRERTGEHYLEDIFLKFVPEKAADELV